MARWHTHDSLIEVKALRLAATLHDDRAQASHMPYVCWRVVPLTPLPRQSLARFSPHASPTPLPSPVRFTQSPVKPGPACPGETQSHPIATTCAMQTNLCCRRRLHPVSHPITAAQSTRSTPSPSTFSARGGCACTLPWACCSAAPSSASALPRPPWASASSWRPARATGACPSSGSVIVSER